MHTLYHGTAGVAVFYLELHRATGERRHLDTAIAAADHS
ncbi:MAG: lanthionine synthetase LanC family protein [Acidimicrobiales bacterium]